MTEGVEEQGPEEHDAERAAKLPERVEDPRRGAGCAVVDRSEHHVEERSDDQAEPEPAE